MNTTERVFEFIENFIDENGFPPSVREIGKALKISSTASVFYHLEKLEKMGLIKRNALKNRAMEIVSKKKPKTVSVPLVGRVAAGVPILAIENIEDVLPLPETMFGDGGELYMLTVVGESMINIGINDGDYIIVKKQTVANNGEVVVAMMDGEVTVKTFYKETNRFRLQPQNDSMQPIYCTELDILGIVKGLLRKF